MKRNLLQSALVLSLLLNFGVIAALGYHLLASPGHGGETQLADYLGLSEAQRRQWHEKEVDFMRELGSTWEQIRVHRERLIREVFSDNPDPAVIEAERAAIARLQEEQQRRVLRQLLAERAMLDPSQRVALADLLIRQEPAGTLEERLHRK
jgi:Spy/CpxP family protein refolding chaperone